MPADKHLTVSCVCLGNPGSLFTPAYYPNQLHITGQQLSRGQSLKFHLRDKAPPPSGIYVH